MKKIFLVCTVVFVMACDSVSKPSNLLEREQMVDLLSELAILHSLQTYHYNQDTIYVYQTKKDILDKYNLDSIQFEAQHDYYRSNLDEYAKLHTDVKAKIESKLEEVESLPNDEKEEENVNSTTNVNVSSKFLKNYQEN